MDGNACCGLNVSHSTSYARYATLNLHSLLRLPAVSAILTRCVRNNLSRETASGYTGMLRRGRRPAGRPIPLPPESLVPARLDDIDRHILRELQDDGRITNVELARRVGISAPPCLRRVRALEEAGYIKGYRALLDEKLLGFEVTVFAMVHLSSQAETD